MASSVNNEMANGTRVPDSEALIADELNRTSELPVSTMPADAIKRARDFFVELVTT